MDMVSWLYPALVWMEVSNGRSSCLPLHNGRCLGLCKNGLSLCEMVEGVMAALNKEVQEYWAEYFISNALCSLCGNSGVINTIGVTSRAGIHCGRLNWCICPNGQIMRYGAEGKEPL